MDKYEILVPYHDNNGERFSKRMHHGWDEAVCQFTGGLMLRGIVKGKWGAKREKVIRVEIVCEADVMKKIAEFTKKHYDQEQVLYGKVCGPYELV